MSSLTERSTNNKHQSLGTFRHGLDRLFRDMETDLLMPRGSSASALLPFSSGSMSMDVKETESGYTMAVEVPGMSKENINISVDEARSTVTITSERKAEKEDKQEGWLLRERSYGKSQRSVLLPETADLNKAEVELKVSIYLYTLVSHELV
jgi:HSP20 family protein